MWKKVTSIVGALVLLSTVISGYIWFDSRYAKASDTQKNSIEIKINGLKDDIRWYQDQMMFLLNRYELRDPQKLPEGSYRSYCDYNSRKEELEVQLQILIEKRSGQ